MAELREYGVATEVYMVVPKLDDTDLAATADYAYTAGDIKLSKDGAATANPASSPTEIDMGTFMFLQIDLSASEMQCESLLIQIADAALEHNALVIETYGHASSRHPGILGSANGQKLDLQLEHVEHGTAQAGAASSITLASGASTSDDAYNNAIVHIVGGTGAGQMPRFIDDYTGSTRVADVSPAWSTTPDATSVYLVIPSPPASTSVPPEVNVVQNDGVAITASGGVQEVNVTQVSGVAEDLPTATALATVDTVVDAILVDTGTTLDAAIATIDGIVDQILADTGTTLDAALAVVDANVDAIKAVTDNLPNSGALTGITTHLTDIKGVGWSSGTDTLEAIRDRGDAAWTTGAGGTPPQELVDTTIATLASQVSFTLTAGSADDDAYNDMLIVITDQLTSTQKAVGTISDYTGGTKTVTLSADPGIFTMAVGDQVQIIATGVVSGLAAAAIADAVLDEALSGHTTSGTLGERIGLMTTNAAAAERAAIADAILARNIAGGSDGGRTVTSALRLNRNRTTTSGGILTVYEEDDTTVAWTAAISTAAGDPITDFDPV